MFEKLIQLIQKEGFGHSVQFSGSKAEKQSLERQLTRTRELKKDTAYRLFCKFTTHLNAMGDYEKITSLGNRADYDTFRKALGAKLDPDMSPSFDCICSLSSKIFHKPEDMVPKIITWMLSEKYRPPKKIDLLWRHFQALVIYYALPFKSHPIVTDLRIDIAMTRLSYALGRITKIVYEEGRELYRTGKSTEVIRSKIVKPTTEMVREMEELLNGKDSEWPTYTLGKKAQRIAEEITFKYDGEKSVSIKTVERRLKELIGQT